TLAPFPSSLVAFFFQAEDGIRDRNVTGVQTCALPIWVAAPWHRLAWPVPQSLPDSALLALLPLPEWACPAIPPGLWDYFSGNFEIGRASCRGRVWGTGGEVPDREQGGGR